MVSDDVGRQPVVFVAERAVSRTVCGPFKINIMDDKLKKVVSSSLLGKEVPNFVALQALEKVIVE